MEPKIEIEWLIHYKCNYRCPYCFFEGTWEEVERRNVYRATDEWLRVWMLLRQRYGYMRLLITGGEPFIYPGFVDLLGELSKEFSIGFDSNLSCSKELLIDFAEKVRPKDISIAASFHPFFAEFEPFLEKALFLKDNKYRICVQYVSYPEQISKLNFYREKFAEKGLYFIPLPFRGRYNNKIYPDAHTAEEKKLLYSSMEDLTREHQDKVDKLLNQVKSKKKLCRAGQVYARVDNDGTVYRCGHSVSNPSVRPLGNIFDEGFALLDNPVSCEYELCPCESRWLVDAG